MPTLIVIPARYGSTRFPGKPLARVAGVPMLLRVVRQAERALAETNRPGTVVVATDSDAIADFARAEGVACVMTSDEIRTGSDRAHAAAECMARDHRFEADVIVNWQGDNPCCPTPFAAACIAECAHEPNVAVATPCIRLRWRDVDRLREHKLTTPFSGTFAVLRPVDPSATADGASRGVLERGDALLFSKREVPALRDEKRLRADAAPDDFSPLIRHIGLYAYRRPALARYAAWPQGPLERHEGLEQLRFLENGVPVRALVMDDGGMAPMTGVDSPEDIPRAEAWLTEAGLA